MQKTFRPRYDLRIDRNIEIPTRDGLRLAANIFCPRGSDNHGQYNAGANTVYAGDSRASYLLLPSYRKNKRGDCYEKSCI